MRLLDALRFALIPLLLPAAAALTADPLAPPGVMLKQGEWRGDVGTFLTPAPLEGLPASRWPMEGWGVLLLDEQAATLSIRPLTAAEARERFKPILAQRLLAEQHVELSNEQPTPEGNGDRYVRVPGIHWKPQTVPLHRFKNGTTMLTPELGYRFQLKLGDLPYAFTLQNGFRTADGRAYGEGTQFRLEIGGQVYDYDLGGYGWDVRIVAIGDFDGDGKPDFIFSLGGSNSDHEALVLSSKAKPGRNPPTTYLSAIGC